MANLPEKTLTTIFNLPKQLFYIIDEATATDYNLVERCRGDRSFLLSIQNIRKKSFCQQENKVLPVLFYVNL